MARQTRVDPAAFFNRLSDIHRYILLSEHMKTKRPNKHTDRVAWNAHFERDLALSFEGMDHKINDTTTMDEKTLRAFEECPISPQLIADATKSLISVQGRLIQSAVENIVFGTFEADWESLQLAKKKELALEGLYRGACAAYRDNSRTSCPEMTIKNLISDSKYNLINLLKRAIAHDPTGSGHIDTYFLFTHPLVDRTYRMPDSASEHVRHGVHQLLLFRTYYITSTLEGILDAFHGHPPQPLTIINTRSNHIKGSCHGSGKFRIDNSQCREERKMALDGCYACHTVMEDRKILKKCSRCQVTWYCSAECQKKDWPNHKKYCGHTRETKFDPNNFVPTPKAPPKFVGCPDPVPGFRRPPALYRQIGHLSRADSTERDYHLDRFYMHTRSIKIVVMPEKIIFLVARRRAMASGCRASVWRMYRTIESHQSHHQLPLDKILRQLEGEYNVSLNPPPTEPFASPTPQELSEEWEYCIRRRLGLSLEDPFPRNYRRFNFAKDPMWQNLS